MNAPAKSACSSLCHPDEPCSITATGECPQVRRRTAQQRKALEVFSRECAKHLNQQGVEFHAVWDSLQKRGVEVMWDQENFKGLFRTILAKVYPGKTSTSEASTTEYNVIYEGLCKWFAQEYGVQLPPWPSREGDDAA